MYFNGRAIFSFTADSGMRLDDPDEKPPAPHETLASALLLGGTMLMDARKKGNSEHASFEQAIEFQEKLNNRVNLYIHHHAELNPSEKWPQLRFTSPGQRIQLWPTPTN